MANCEEFSFSDLAHNFPPFIPRTEIQKYFPWLTPKRLANLDSAGQGPPALRNGRAVIYPINELMSWLDSRNRARGRRQSLAEPMAMNEEKPPAGKSNCGNLSRPRRGRKTKNQEVRERRGLS